MQVVCHGAVWLYFCTLLHCIYKFLFFSENNYFATFWGVLMARSPIFIEFMPMLSNFHTALKIHPPTPLNHHHIQLQNFPNLPHRQNYRFHSPAAKFKNFAFLPKISFPQPIHSNITQKLITLNNNSQKVIHNHSPGY